MRINIGEFLTRRAMLNADREALVCEGRRWTFGELNRRANRLAHAMENLGVRPGDRVGVIADNGVHHYDLLFGLAKSGVIMVPINNRLAAPEVTAVVKDAGLRVLVYGGEYEALVREVEGCVPPFQKVKSGEGGEYEDMLSDALDSEPMLEASNDDELAILYANWAADGPRGVLLSHENIFWGTVTAAATLDQLGPVFLLALPMFHVGALAWLPFFMHRGVTCVLMPRFDADRFLDLMEGEKATAFGAVPTMLCLLKDSERFASADFTKVQSILAYGSAVPVELIREYAGHDIRVRQLYGLTESAGPVLVIDGEHALLKAGSCGFPFFHTDVRLVNEIGLEVTTDAVGEVIIRAGHVMKGYWNAPDATGDAIRNGWLFTGDLARRDRDGFYYIVDRKKELIISGGENINPAQVEAAMFEHPGVADAAVTGTPDPLWGEVPKASVVKKEGVELTEHELISFLKERLAGYKVPRTIEFKEALPRTTTGKMEKRKLRQ